MENYKLTDNQPSVHFSDGDGHATGHQIETPIFHTKAGVPIVLSQ